LKNVSSSYARQNFKHCCDIASEGEPVIVTRQNGGDCVIISFERFSFYEKIADEILHEKYPEK
jgi:prevent-host-death family protein